MTLLAVRHLTTYRYKRPVAFGPHQMMFRPRDSFDQKLLSATLGITPAPVGIRWLHDVFGNCVAIAHFDSEATELVFESNIRIAHTPSNSPEFQMEDYARSYPFSYSLEETPDLSPTMEPQYPSREVKAWAKRFVPKNGPIDTGKLLMTLTYGIRESFGYERRAEIGTREPARTLQLGRGSCRDLALLMMEAARSLGLAARFVSGYLYVPSQDAGNYVGGGSTHAWCQVYVPGSGWVEFDPTNGIVGNRDLIRVAVVRDPSQAIPLHGTFKGAPDDELGMTVEVLVREHAEPDAAPTEP